MSYFSRRCLLTVCVTALSIAVVAPGTAQAADNGRYSVAHDQAQPAPAAAFVQDVAIAP